MPKDSSKSFQINVGELNKILELVEKIVDELKKIAKIPKEEREEIRKAVMETCESIDGILLSVKLALDDIQEALKHDYADTKDKISQLSNAGEWENKYREFKLCWPLRRATGEIRDTVFGRLKKKFSFKNPDELSNSLNSSSVRSQPPVVTSISRSRSLAIEG